MSFFANKSNKASAIDSLIGAGTTINGDVNFTGGLRVDGVVKGNIRAVGDKPGTLVLSELAKVEGEIDVGHVVVNGTVAGPVRAKEYLELLPKARVTGDVSYKTIEIHVGAIVMGRMVHEGESRLLADKVIEFKPAIGN
ncbi:MAG: polymer-forming cytoskeletal protein [Burkholderiales bacterium]|nr:polymer-forming cytoskeletal protein [Burkholderiales bacterium]